MIQIQLEPEVEARLTAEARSRGFALEVYIAGKLTKSKPAQCRGRRRATVAAAVDSIRELRKGSCLGGLKIKDLIHEGHAY